MLKGKFIVFEGVDGSGKSTQLNLLADSLIKAGHKLVITREPGGTKLGKTLRKILLNTEIDSPLTEILLFAADRAYHLETIVIPALNKGEIVLCDRFIYSTLAYQGYGKGLGFNLINQLNSVATNNLKPDLVIWLDVDIQTALERVKTRGNLNKIDEFPLEFYERVNQGFKQLHLMNKFVRVDGTETRSIVHQRVLAKIQELISGF